MVSLVWGKHALPLYWEVLNQVGNSDLKTQQRLLKAVLPLFKHYPVLVLGDREFHSPKLAAWLDSRGVSFALRQKKDFHFQVVLEPDYQVLKDLGFKPGMSKFYAGILGTKGDGIGPFNLAVYWKRKYRNRGAKEPWYILTNLPTLNLSLAVYRCRWGIETSYRLKNHCRIRTTTKNPVLRLLFVALAFILVNLWVYLLCISSAASDEVEWSFTRGCFP